MKSLNYILIVCLASFLACSNNGGSRKAISSSEEGTLPKNQVKVVKSLRLKSPLRDQLFVEGESVPVVVIPRRKAASIDSLQFISEGKVLHTIYKEPWNYNWKPEGRIMGSNTLKILAYHSDETIGQLSSQIKLKPAEESQKYKVKIVKAFPHDKGSYTQGLFYYDGFFFEGTGQRGESSIRKVNPENGEVISVLNMDSSYFGEGITLFNHKILQLTWTSGKAFEYNMDDFQQLNVFYPQTTNGEGWGITTMGNELVISDGSNVLTILDAGSYSRKRTVEVYDHNGPVKNLNELEYINGMIYANVWLTDRIVIIDPQSGKVNGDIDLAGLLTPSERRKLADGDDVLNGIAWDEQNQRLFVTGKRWPKLFEIQLEEK